MWSIDTHRMSARQLLSIFTCSLTTSNFFYFFIFQQPQTKCTIFLFHLSWRICEREYNTNSIKCKETPKTHRFPIPNESHSKVIKFPINIGTISFLSLLVERERKKIHLIAKNGCDWRTQHLISRIHLNTDIW